MKARVSDARLYLVAPSHIGTTPLHALIPELVDAGVGIVQLREKNLEALDLIRVAAPALDECRRADIPFIVNDRPDVALALGADGVHLGQGDLPVEVARRILGDAIVGRSTHSRSQIDSEVQSGETVDYIAVGPVFATPTKPDRPSVGLELIRHAVRHVAIPWFAIGGIDENNLAEVTDAGARRVVVVRAITEADDPVGAAARLRASLDQVPVEDAR